MIDIAKMSDEEALAYLSERLGGDELYARFWLSIERGKLPNGDLVLTEQETTGYEPEFKRAT